MFVYVNESVVGGDFDIDFVDVFIFEFEFYVCDVERAVDEVSYRVSFFGGDDEVFWSVLLKYFLYVFDVVVCVVLIMFGVYVIEV